MLRFTNAEALLRGQLRQLGKLWNQANSQHTVVAGYRSPVGPTVTLDSEADATDVALTADGSTIVCLHSSDIEVSAPTDAQPLRRRKPNVSRRDSLSEEEIHEVKELRHQDPSLWTINTLARLFNVKPVVLSRIAPMPEERKRQLDEIARKLSGMKPYKRHRYKAELEEKRQERLRKALDGRQQQSVENSPANQAGSSD